MVPTEDDLQEKVTYMNTYITSILLLPESPFAYCSHCRYSALQQIKQTLLQLWFFICKYKKIL